MARDVLLYIQPAYNCIDKRVEYAEVLIRRYRGIEGVTQILKFVTKNKLEVTFDLDVLKTVANHVQGRKLPYPIGINLCPGSIASENIVSSIKQVINDSGMQYNDIIIEINECTDFNSDIVYKNIKSLQKLGIKIALDDFGVEKANLYSLLHYKFDILKVDKSFIGHEKEESKNQILSIIKELCSKFNMKPIIEGVENRRQLNTIYNMGYTIVQGYIYTEPVPLNDFVLT